MNTTASTSTQSTATPDHQGFTEGFELPQPASVTSLEAGFAWLIRQARHSTGLTDAGLFWFSYLGLIGLVAFAALA